MKSWSMNKKLYFVVLIFVISSFLISYLGSKKISHINSSLEKIVNENVERLSGAEEIKANFLTQIINEKNYILAENVEDQKKYLDRLIKRNDELQKMLENNLQNASEEDKKDLLAFQNIYGKWWTNFEEIEAKLSGGDKHEAIVLSSGLGYQLRNEADVAMEHVIVNNKKAMKNASIEAKQEYKDALLLLISTSVIAVVLGFVMAYIILQALSKSIKYVITKLNQNSEAVSVAADKMSSTSTELSQATTEQAASLEETAASIEEVNSMVQKNADYSSQANELSESSQKDAFKAKEVVQTLLVAIDGISKENEVVMQSIEESNKKISEIVSIISEIGNKTKVINEIVFQTKLLSFNASVEAARAGENGKGFAVVAEEVGKLAQMSGDAAKDISNMLEESKDKVESIVSDTKEKVEHLLLTGRDKVQHGQEIAKNCDKVLGEILEKAKRVNQMTSEISLASKEQAQGVFEITKAINQLDQVTQINAATTEDTANSATQLSSQATSLKEVIIMLEQSIYGLKQH